MKPTGTEDYSEYAYNPERDAAERKRNIQKAFRLTIVIVGFALVLGIIISAVVIFGVFRVRTVSVSGMVNYTNKEIVAASGVKIGDNMMFSDFDKAAKKIAAELPFIGTAEAEKKFPSTVIFKVTPSEATYAYYCASQKGYIITDENLKILSTSMDVPEGIGVITGNSNPEDTKPGSVLTLVEDSENAYEMKLLKVIVRAIKAEGIKGITSIDITDKTDVRIVYENRIMMKLGLGSEINEKINLAAQVLESENAISSTQTGTMDLSLADKAYFKPDFFDGILPGQEETEEDEENEDADEDGENDEDDEDGDEGEDEESTEYSAEEETQEETEDESEGTADYDDEEDAA